MQCSQCSRNLDARNPAAAISGSIMGDEHTDVWVLCPACNSYTVATYWDNFTGTESTRTSGPVPKPEGDRRVALIRGCPEPWDKKCHCAAHKEYFGGSLD